MVMTTLSASDLLEHVGSGIAAAWVMKASRILPSAVASAMGVASPFEKSPCGSSLAYDMISEDVSPSLNALSGREPVGELDVACRRARGEAIGRIVRRRGFQ